MVISALTPWTALEAVILTVPLATPVTTPAAETLAIAAFSLAQVTVLSSASSGVTVAWRVKVLPFLTVAVAPSAIATPVAGFGATEEETGASELTGSEPTSLLAEA